MLLRLSCCSPKNNPDTAVPMIDSAIAPPTRTRMLSHNGRSLSHRSAAIVVGPARTCSGATPAGANRHDDKRNRPPAATPATVTRHRAAARWRSALYFDSSCRAWRRPLSSVGLCEGPLGVRSGKSRCVGWAAWLGVFALALNALVFVFFAFRQQSTWLVVLAIFMVWNCWAGLKHAMVLLKMAKLPRRHGFFCPTCRNSPPLGEFWGCSNCKQRFDTFATQGKCPHCGAQFLTTRCMDCGRAHPMTEWAGQTPIPEPPLVIKNA